MQSHLVKYAYLSITHYHALQQSYKIGFSEKSGVDLALSGNYTDVFSNALSSVAKSVGSDVKAEIQGKIADKTSGYSKDALAKLSEFTGISADLNTQANSIDDMKKALNAKLSELAEKQKEAVKSKATEKATDAVSNALKKFGR